MTHLGDRVTDLVDGQLTPEATETAHAHLAGCMPCRELVEAERLMKARLRTLGAPTPSGDLVARLLAVGGAGQVDDVPDPADAARPGRVVRPAGGSVPGRPVSSRPAGSRPGGRADGGRPAGRATRRSRRLTAAVIGALSLAGVGAVGLSFSAGLSPATVLPPVATFVVERTATTRDIPFVTVPASWLGEDGSASDH